MSLHVFLSAVRPTIVFDANVTHNLAQMARLAGIYEPIWRPENLEITVAGELVEPLKKGLAVLKEQPERFIPLNPKNGYGSYEHFVEWVEKYLQACIKDTDARITVLR